MLIQTQIGPVAATQSISPGVLAPVRAGQLGDVIVSELHGRYYETTYRRNMFTANVALQTTTAGTPATYTGLVVYNPIGSTINMVLNKVGIAWGAALAAGYFGVMYGYSSGNITTLTTAQTPRNKFFGVGAAGQGLAASSIVAASAFTSVEVLGSMGSLATTGYLSVPYFYDFEGSTVLPPGALAAIFTNVITTSSLCASFDWEEVPL